MIDFKLLIEPTFQILKESEEGLEIKEIEEKLIEKMQISQEVLAQKHKDSKQSEFAYRAGWARTYLKKYGVIQNPERGFWKINDTYNGEEIRADVVVSDVMEKRSYKASEKIEEKEQEIDITADNQRYMEELKEHYKRHRLALFLGAGVSMAANMPSWDALIFKFLLERFQEENKSGLTESIIQDLQKIAKENQEGSPLMQTRFARQNMSPEKYLELLMGAIYQSEENIDNELFESLVRLIRQKNAIYIKDIITFNFDDLLEKKLIQKDIYYKSYSGISSDKNENSVNIYHVHGYLEREVSPDEIDIDNIVFSEEQYHKMYTDIYNWSNLQQINTLREKTCVFIGCSLNDPNTRRLLDIVYKEGETKHYAIMKKEEIKVPNGIEAGCEAYKYYQTFYMQNRNAYYNSLGIYVIWVDDYAEIPKILKKIGNV